MTEQKDLCSSFCPHPEKAALLKERVMEVSGLSELFGVLADETRTRILHLLSFEELCVCDLAEVLEMSMPAISHHLRLLKTMHMVKYRREGKMAFYSLADQHVLELVKLAQVHYAEQR